MIYLDNNATTRPLPAVVDAVRLGLEARWANPSSVHRAGQDARAAVELARASVARLIGARPREVVFTSGGTESIDLAIRGALAASSRRAIVTDAVEHEAVRGLAAALQASGAAEVRRIPVTREGVVDAGAAAGLIDDAVAIVSVQWANNETGAVQPVGAIGRLCRERRVPFHVDGVQWVGKAPTDVGSGETPIDLLSLAAHKMHGPKGVGALWVRRGVRVSPRLLGAQEMERRGGTENVPGILGFGAAAEAALAWLADPGEAARLGAMRDRFERAVLARAPGSRVNGPTGPGERLWNTTNIGFPRLEAEALLLLLSERGVCASAGAACSSGSLEPSPVLLAMGVPAEVAHGSLRFSLSRETTAAEVDEAAEIVAGAAERLRASSGAALG